MRRCERGEVFFDLSPSVLFDCKLILSWPFCEATRDEYSDEVRALFPYTQVIEPDGFELASGEHVTIEELCSLPRSERQYYVKYAGSDVALNWGSKAVFRADRLSREQRRDLVETIVRDRDRGRYWIVQESVRFEEPVSAFSRDGGVIDGRAYTKWSGFYGPDGLMGIVVMQRRAQKVHGGGDTIFSIVH